MENKRIALVSGGNKGIGLEIARQLAKAGVTVIIGARNDDRAASALEDLNSNGLNVQSVHLDLDKPESLAAAETKIKAQYGRLNILVNNAGVFDFADATPSKASINAVRRVMEVNFFGALALTQVMLPLLRNAPEGRIVNISSSLGSLTLNGDPNSTFYAQQYIGYNASKAALSMLTVQLNEELSDTNIKVNSVSPGFVKTDLTGYGEMTPEEGARLPVQFALNSVETGGFFEPKGRTPW
ncbi:SDR family oxidoreductase [Ahrensia kielensis]|uniref:SDR family oxidoreductase n=1 Tax=Ahrensia kielensis TaxID=76980 RepID=UPI0003A358F2|nr:SDR family oxidoreductase [Ahrensia kielensis]